MIAIRAVRRFLQIGGTRVGTELVPPRITVQAYQPMTAPSYGFVEPCKRRSPIVQSSVITSTSARRDAIRAPQLIKAGEPLFRLGLMPPFSVSVSHSGDRYHPSR